MPRLTNAQLADTGREYKQAKAAEHQAKQRAEQVRDVLLADLARRKVDTIEVAGMVITRKTKRSRVWSTAKLVKLLSRTLAAKVLYLAVNTKELDAAVKAGDVAKARVDACIVRTDVSAPYVDVTLRTAA